MCIRDSYKATCTHGWTVDGEGKKMSKSIGNVILPEEIIKQYGADILRLWVASSDYHSDVRISKEMLKQLSDIYRKIRNTARFMLSNLGDFNPDTDLVPIDQLTDLDLWALNRLNEVIAKCKEGYDSFEFHVAYHEIHNYCIVAVSYTHLPLRCRFRWNRRPLRPPPFCFSRWMRMKWWKGSSPLHPQRLQNRSCLFTA